MTEDLELIKTAAKEKLWRLIAYISKSEEDVKVALQEKINYAFTQVSSLSHINARYVEENMSLKRYFVEKFIGSKSLQSLIGASLLLLKSFSSDIESLLEESDSFYITKIASAFSNLHDEDRFLKDFTKYLFIAVKSVGISTAHNQGMLINMCAFLQSVDSCGGIVFKYSSGGGMTDALKRRMMVYALLAGNEEEARSYRAEVMAKQSTRKKTGNHSLELVFKPEEVILLNHWPKDDYALLRNQLAHHTYTIDNYDQLAFLMEVHCLFTDIPYFTDILFFPLSILYQQLVAWSFTYPGDFNELPHEREIVDNYLPSSDVSDQLNVTSDLRNELWMVLIGAKILFLRSHRSNSKLLLPYTPDIISYRALFSGVFEPSPDLEQDEEWQWMINYHLVVALIHATAPKNGKKVNQQMYFEIAQRLEGSGKSYTKGGDRTASSERRLVIIERVTGKMRRTKKTAAIATTTVVALAAEKVNPVQSESKESGKRRKTVKALPAPAPLLAPPQPHFENLFRELSISKTSVVDTNENLRAVSEAEKRGQVHVGYEAGAPPSDFKAQDSYAWSELSLFSNKAIGLDSNLMQTDGSGVIDQMINNMEIEMADDKEGEINVPYMIDSSVDLLTGSMSSLEFEANTAHDSKQD